MQLVSKKNFIVLLAAVLVVGFGLMSMFLNNKKLKTTNMESQNKQLEIQKPLSKSDSPAAIEEDLDNTNVEDLDKELQGMEDELGNP